jgi:hypothetical protein
MELGGPVPGVEHDQLIVTGAALLDGTLAIELIDGYVPKMGETFTLFQWSAVSGTFSNTSMPEWLVLDVSRLYTDGTILVVVPEPGTLALLITGAFGLLLLGWRNRQFRGNRRLSRPARASWIEARAVRRSADPAAAAAIPPANPVPAL